MKQSRLRDRKLGLKKVVKKTKRSFLKPFLFIVFLLLVVLIGVYIVLPKTWSGKEKISIAFQKGDDGAVIILDPSVPSVTTIDIPGETELTASNQLGIWKVKSLQQLGEDENLGGILLKNTYIKSLNFPIDYWADENFVNLTSGNLIKGLSSVFKSKYTNLSFIDRIKITLFSLSVGNSQRTTINLASSSYLEKTQLKDSSLGYTVRDQIPSKIEVYFTLQDIANLNLLINNKSSRVFPAEMVSRGVEVLGINVAAIERGNEEDFDCKIIGINKIVYKLAHIFTCDVELSKPSNNFDIEITIGTKFKDRF